jgi:hypothetical protein
MRMPWYIPAGILLTWGLSGWYELTPWGRVGRGVWLIMTGSAPSEISKAAANDRTAE